MAGCIQIASARVGRPESSLASQIRNHPRSKRPTLFRKIADYLGFATELSAGKHFFQMTNGTADTLTRQDVLKHWVRRTRSRHRSSAVIGAKWGIQGDIGQPTLSPADSLLRQFGRQGRPYVPARTR